MTGPGGNPRPWAGLDDVHESDDDACVLEGLTPNPRRELRLQTFSDTNAPRYVSSLTETFSDLFRNFLKKYSIILALRLK